MNNMKIGAGEIFLDHAHNVTGRVIQFGMNLERWRKLQFRPFWKKVYNHAGIGIGGNELSEALGGGITNQDINVAYRDDKNKEFLIYKIPGTTAQHLKEIKKISKEYNGVKYQFINFLQYVPKILFGVWLGKKEKGSEDRLYCTEYVGMILWKVYGIEQFKDYWVTSPSEVQNWCKENCILVNEYKI